MTWKNVYNRITAKYNYEKFLVFNPKSNFVIMKKVFIITITIIIENNNNNNYQAMAILIKTLKKNEIDICPFRTTTET